MAGILVCGAQWGDEGKGRFVDLLANTSDMVIRFQGGNNAGHTVIVGGETYKLHLIPSGILYEGKPCIIGNGVVVNPKGILQEIDGLQARGIDTSALAISDRAHIVMPYHAYLDGIYEDNLGDNKIGTTKKGIGPAYTDKTTRVGIRCCDMLDEARFASLVKKQVEDKNEIITKVYNKAPLSAQEIIDEYLGYAKRLKPYIKDTSLIVYQAHKQGKTLLFEGAQGMLLDLDYGTYPFVTSSHPTAGGVFSGVGIGPRALDEIIGIVKAYTTRVGAGPFATELECEVGEAIREKGFEYGTTTGRPRRCGWLDLVIIEFAARINGITSIALSKMDTLGGFDKIKVCVGYEFNGEVIRNYPASLSDLEKCKPVYKEFEGWGDEIGDVRNYDDLPAQAKTYIEFIEEFLDIPVDIIGVGPKRDECIVRKTY
jgi:adenylosuccinate synthase